MKDELKIRSKVDDFVFTNNMFSLAEAYILIEKLLNKEKFPIKEYKKWKKQN